VQYLQRILRPRDTSTRTAIELQVGKNILAIASHHLGNPDRAADYFNQSLLEDPTRANDEVKDQRHTASSALRGCGTGAASVVKRGRAELLVSPRPFMARA
jgi:hypothetical protein